VQCNQDGRHAGVVLHHPDQALRGDHTEKGYQPTPHLPTGADCQQSGTEADKQAQIADQQVGVRVNQRDDLNLEPRNWPVAEVARAVALAVARPALVTLVVGEIQGATSLQDQTVSNVPRMIAVYAAIAAGGAWALREIVATGVRLLEQLPLVQL
jgi:flagellar biosynthesis protein FliQ